MVKIINCKHFNKEFKVSNKNKTYKFCEICRKNSNLKYSIYRENDKNFKENINSSLKNLQITFTGNVGYRIKLSKYKEVGFQTKYLNNKFIYLEFIEELQQILEEEKENISKW